MAQWDSSRIVVALVSYLSSAERSAVDSFIHSSSAFVCGWKELWQSKMSCLLAVVSCLGRLWRAVSVQSRVTKVVKGEMIHCWLVQTSSSRGWMSGWVSAEGIEMHLGASAITGLARVDVDYWLDPMWKTSNGQLLCSLVTSCVKWSS